MSSRPSPRPNTVRMLWAESIGHCMNPACQVELICNGSNIGEMAHIVSHEDGGDVSFENMILLCRPCHKITDDNKTEAMITQLRQWKRDRNSEIERRFAKSYLSFEDLSESVTPILRRNQQIFDRCGPNDAPDAEERHKLWLRFEGEMISNNRRLELMLTKNMHLFPDENRDIVDEFVAHAREFVATRDENQILRTHLFPEKLLSVFGIEQVQVEYPPNLSALQNFVTHLIETDRFISLDLIHEPHINYLDGGESVTLMIEDRPRVQQVFWNGRFFKPKTTDVRIENLVFFVRWLHGNDIRYEFADIRELTALTLNGSYEIRLCYKYRLSRADLYMMKLDPGDIVVNLHQWNNAPITDEADSYASQIGVRLFGQNRFFVFAHNELK